MQVKVAISARHIHLTEETYKVLFGNTELTKRNNLNQIGQFASNEVVTIKTIKKEIPNVRILGPLRKYNQVELSRTDAISLGINPPVRRSGDLDKTPGITIVGPKSTITLDNGVIVAERHIHFDLKLAKKNNIIDGQPLFIKIKGTKGMNKDKYSEKLVAFAKVSEDGYFEMHIDTDDANAIGLNMNDEVEITL